MGLSRNGIYCYQVDIPDTVSPCGLQRALQASFENAHSEAAGFLHALRLACAQVSTLEVEVRPSKERLVNNLRMTIPNIGINARRGGAVVEAALKCSAIYKPVLAETADLSEVLSRPSKCVSGVGLSDIADAASLLIVKLTDFGCSKRSEETCKHTLRGSIPWMAPEVMNERAYGRKADVWSLGCVFIEMITAKPPWGLMTNPLATMVRETPPVNVPISETFRDIITICTRRDPEERLLASELMNHPFLALEETLSDS
eukprot:s3674_g3.t1